MDSGHKMAILKETNMSRRGENIRKRKDGRWEARVVLYNHNHTTKYKYFYANSYNEVKRKKNEFIKKQQSPAVSNGISVMFSILANNYLNYKHNQIKESTFVHYKYLIDKYINPILGKYDNSTLTADIINESLKLLIIEKQLSPRSILSIRTLIKAIIKYGELNQYYFNIKEDLFIPKSANKSIDILTRHEQSILTKYLLETNQPYATGVLITLFHGLRIGEICALQWKDIDLQNEVIHINKTLMRIIDVNIEHKTIIRIDTPKTESSIRTIPIPSFLIPTLTKRRQANDQYVLTGTYKYMEPRSCLKRFKTLLKKNNINEYTFHVLRHTFATRCVEINMDVKSLSEILGHSNVNTTLQRYVHPTLESKRKQMNKLTYYSKLEKTH